MLNSLLKYVIIKLTFKIKRLTLVFISFVCFLLIETINWLFILLDNIIYPSYKNIELKPPVFIIGMPRSGTTLCFNLFAADKRLFTSMKLWEILFAPSIIQKKLILSIKNFDRKFNHIFLKSIQKFDLYFFRKTISYHPISLFNIEEDDYLFIHTLSSVSLLFMFPHIKSICALKQFDELLSATRKKTLMTFYKNCIKKHLFVYGTEKQYLAKSPSHTPKIMTLIQYFPECRLIYLLRDPLKSIASTAFLLKQFGKIFFSADNTKSMINEALGLADNWYTYPLITCKDLHKTSMIILKFENLISDPFSEIKKTYKNLDYDMSHEITEFMEQAFTFSKDFKSDAKVNPEEIGLNAQLITERYSVIYKDFIKP